MLGAEWDDVVWRKCRRHAGVAGRLIGRCKSHSGVVRLLGRHAVEADGAAGQSRHASVPDGAAKAFAAVFGLDDVKPDEPEGLAIGDRRDAGDHCPLDENAEETVRIGGVECRSVGEAGVPAFRRGTADEGFDLGQGQDTDVGRHAGAKSFIAPS